jgi:predicted house-cleaning NTP pyrophosphatase (Maf/HAM1 superfamily)
MIPGIDEKAIRADDPTVLPVLIAKAKADAVFQQMRSDNTSTHPSSFVLLTADQIVLFKDEVREKPENRDEAIHFLSSYSCDKVSTISAVVATHFPSGRQAYEVDIATVYWKEIPSDAIHRVVDRAQIFTSAGGALHHAYIIYPSFISGGTLAANH